MASQIKLRRGTAAQWTSANPVLAQGEAGFETDTYKLKIGNGTSAWNALTYFSPTPDLSAYLTQASASATYLTQIDASSTYLTQSNASSTYATKTELENIDLSSASAAAVAYLVDGAPSALDTLNELSAALNDDSSFATTVTNSLSTKAPIVDPVFTNNIQVDGQINLLNPASAAYINGYSDIMMGGNILKVGSDREVILYSEGSDPSKIAIVRTVAGNEFSNSNVQIAAFGTGAEIYLTAENESIYLNTASAYLGPYPWNSDKLIATVSYVDSKASALHPMFILGGS